MSVLARASHQATAGAPFLGHSLNLSSLTRLNLLSHGFVAFPYFYFSESFSFLIQLERLVFTTAAIPHLYYRWSHLSLLQLDPHFLVLIQLKLPHLSIG